MPPRSTLLRHRASRCSLSTAARPQKKSGLCRPQLGPVVLYCVVVSVTCHFHLERGRHTDVGHSSASRMRERADPPIMTRPHLRLKLRSDALGVLQLEVSQR
jgi:hypothetical protein